jgi:uncharacterized protein
LISLRAAITASKPAVDRLYTRQGNMNEHNHDEHQLADFRAAKDEFMRDDPHSPISDKERKTFPGLSYYPFNPALHLHLPLDRDVSEGAVSMETSTGASKEYRRAGKIQIEVAGQTAQLTIFQDPAGELFLPLRDATSGKETYGAGRYLEPEVVDDESVHVDFNYLYNPYCAYNEAFSCPLPPVENWLRVPIAAGEKIFQPS